MDRLWSPWRSKYIRSFGTPDEEEGCVFCSAADSADDDGHYLVKRHEHCFALLNTFPYNSGHLLLVPNKHTSSFHELDAAEYAEIMLRIRDWMTVLNNVMHPQGFNFGSNIGRAGGAGIDQHIHLHLVPRWNGDVNFMPAIGETKVISEALDDTLHSLRAAYNELEHTFTL
jgi:ATP adenylyltransferase